MKLTHERYHDLHGLFQDIITHYGQSDWSHFLPDLVIIHDPSEGIMGEFDDSTEEVTLNIARCNRMSQAINTMIHEYQHYLQPRNE
jgi:hypothetical protein